MRFYQADCILKYIDIIEKTVSLSEIYTKNRKTFPGNNI